MPERNLRQSTEKLYIQVFQQLCEFWLRIYHHFPHEYFPLYACSQFEMCNSLQTKSNRIRFQIYVSSLKIKHVKIISSTRAFWCRIRLSAQQH